MYIDVKKLNENAVIPTRAHDGDAGVDLYACIESPVVISPNETVMIPTGIAIPDGYFGGILARSGLATKQGLRPANCIGVCDTNYRGEYMVALHNDSSEERTINPNDRIAQLVVIPFLHANFVEVNELNETERGVDGFGSTGV